MFCCLLYLWGLEQCQTLNYIHLMVELMSFIPGNFDSLVYWSWEFG